MRKIEIDGDQFMIGVPTANLWEKQFVLTAKKLEKQGLWHDGFNTILDPGNDIASSQNLYGRTDFAPYTGVNYSTQGLGWRPILKPLYPLCDVSGAVTTGGSFYFNGYVQSIPKPEAPLHYQKTFSDFDVGDTEPGKELQWVVWKGYLICNQILVQNIQMKDLKRLRYI